jgi:hypothetical protein
MPTRLEMHFDTRMPVMSTVPISTQSSAVNPCFYRMAIRIHVSIPALQAAIKHLSRLPTYGIFQEIEERHMSTNDKITLRLIPSEAQSIIQMLVHSKIVDCVPRNATKGQATGWRGAKQQP